MHLPVSLSVGGVGEKAYFGGLFACGQNMGCSSRLSSLFYSLSMKKHFRTYLLGVFWFILYLLEWGVVLEDLSFA